MQPLERVAKRRHPNSGGVLADLDVSSRQEVDSPQELKGELMLFDYSAPAELYLAKRGGGQRKPLQFRCFPTAAEAIRFAVEEFPPVPTLGAWMQVGRARFDGRDIQRLYDSGGYPLPRRAS